MAFTSVRSVAVPLFGVDHDFRFGLHMSFTDHLQYSSKDAQSIQDIIQKSDKRNEIRDHIEWRNDWGSARITMIKTRLYSS